MRIRLFSIDLNLGSYVSFIHTILNMPKQKKSAYVCVANVHMLVEAYKDKEFANIVNHADLITPDGKPLTWALKLLYGIRQERAAGMDLLPDLVAAASEKQIKIGFYGGSKVMLAAFNEYILTHHPGTSIACLISPPFRQLKKEEVENYVTIINSSEVQLLFVAMGCPKQEKWMASMKNKVNAVMIGIGGALPVLLGFQKRAPYWMQKLGLEWLYRLFQEPQRLLGRYVSTNSIFILLFFKEYLYHFRDRKTKN